MDFKSLKRSFLAAFPVIGPHTNIEAEMMLAGKKTLTWTGVYDEGTKFEDRALRKAHEGRALLDQAVTDGRLIALDVEQRDPQRPDYLGIFRHYAQPDQKDSLERIVKFNQRAFNRKNIGDTALDKDMGTYLGYRRRDIIFFNHLINTNFMPHRLQNWIIQLNAPCQVALREKLLIECGHDPDEWISNFQTLNEPA